MPKFIHYNIPDCKQINADGKRVYQTPDGQKYPSVTTVLSAIPNPFLAAWKERVGKDAAAAISSKAASRGTRIHTAAEKYLLGEEFTWKMTEGETKEMFRNLCPVLDEFDEIHALEQRLWCDRLRVAGSVDCIAKIADEMYVVDFKTSSRYKNREDIDTYFMQAAAYAMMWYARTGIVVAKSRIIITTQDDGILVYDGSIKKWLQKFVQLRREYK